MELNVFTAISEAAERNRWELIKAMQTHSGGDGYLPHGIALCRRKHFPFPGKEFSTHAWTLHDDDYVTFGAGDYDLTETEALMNFSERLSR